MWFDDLSQYKGYLPRQLYTRDEIGLVPVKRSGMPFPWKDIEYDKWMCMRRNHAIKMSSLPDIICVDLDGKNNFRDVAAVKELTPTLCERSKSGNGFHLFYRADAEHWRDIIGKGKWIGLDLKSYGLVYRMQNQRFNTLKIVDAPDFIYDIYKEQDLKRQANLINSAAKRKAMAEALRQNGVDASEVYGCGYYCRTPAPEGSRNNTIFKATIAMIHDGNPDWAEHARHAASCCGLPTFEIDNMIRQLESYNITP